MTRLPQNFYAGDTVQIAQSLLGLYLVRRYQGETLICRITETEAYVGRCDKACHAYQYRRTNRTETLFGPPGHAYIYLIYGMYNCLNLVTEPEGEPSAVLIRGGEAVAGIDTLSSLRYGLPYGELNAYQRKNFLNGPGKLCKALSLSRAENGMDLTGDTLFVCRDLSGFPSVSAPRIGTEIVRCGRRIGVEYAEESAALPWCFWLEQGG